MSLALSGVAVAQDFPAIIPLSTLDGTTGFQLNGVETYDYSGISVSTAGDVNGDGIDDLLIGAWSAAPNGEDRTGSAYVVFGQRSAFPAMLELAGLNGINGFRLEGVADDDYAGLAVSAAGDVNDDGIDDLLIGAPAADPNGVDDAGSSYVVFGRNVAAEGNFQSTIALSSLNGTDGFRVVGAASGDRSGGAVSAAGDINGDGLDDVLIGAYRADPNGSNSGNSYVVFGRDVAAVGNFPSTLALNSLNGISGFRLAGVAEGDYSGRSVSAAGDINADGVDDLIIGAFESDPNDLESGSSYVVFGRDVAAVGSFPSTLALSSLNGISGFRLDGISGFRLDGEGFRGYSGHSVSAAGDVNGDGIDDLIIGASDADSNGNGSGSSYLVFGRDAASVGNFPSVIALSSLNGTTGFRLDGQAVDDRSGISVSGAGDINGDGVDDLIVGASYADPNGANSGSIYVVFGRDTSAVGNFPSTLALSSLNGSTGFRLDGEEILDQAGRSVSAAGDINGDGADDLVIGAYAANSNGNDSGTTYVVFGLSDDLFSDSFE
ncbi:MAG: integrin alpha [Pseudomonadota bacterium]